MRQATRRAAISGACAALAACAVPVRRRVPAAPSLRLRANTGAIEAAPILLAARDHYPAGITVQRGGIPNLVGAPNIPGVFDPGPADAATHAETQALRYSVDNPQIRIILTVTEGLYRIVARRSAGIAAVADLRGKRVATLPGTSAAFFLQRMLEQAGVDPDTVEVVRVPPDEMARAISERRVDGAAIWEPYSERVASALGDDGIAFTNPAAYRELFNLNSTSDRLADPVLRGEMVDLVRSIIAATAAIEAGPAAAQALTARTTGFAPSEVAAAWPHLRFPSALPDDLPDVLVSEEAWLARQDGREARSRAELEKLIDRSIWDEAVGGSA